LREAALALRDVGQGLSTAINAFRVRTLFTSSAAGT